MHGSLSAVRFFGEKQGHERRNEGDDAHDLPITLYAHHHIVGKTIIKGEMVLGRAPRKQGGNEKGSLEVNSALQTAQGIGTDPQRPGPDPALFRGTPCTHYWR